MSVKNVKQVSCYLTHAQHAALKKLSTKTGAPIQHYLRQGVDLVLKAHSKTKGGA